MKKIMLIVITLACLQSCKQMPKEFSKGEGDLLYLIHDQVSGNNIMPGDFIVMSVKQQTEEGKILYNSNDYDGRPVYRFREPSRFKGDFFSGIGMMSEGDSATLKVNLDSTVNTLGIARPKTKGKFMIYNVSVHKVIARGNLNDNEFNQKMEEYKLTAAEKARIEESHKINHYIEQKRLQTTVLPSGLNYVLLEKGEGAVGKPGDTLKVNFTISYLGGKVFETNLANVAKKGGLYNPSFTYAPAKFLVNTSLTFGFGEALGLFPKGTKAKLIIPSKLAYGNHYYRELGPYTPLLCDFEILDVIQAKPK